MRIAAAIGLGLFAVGAALTWATDWAVAGADGDAIGAILMIAGGVSLLAFILFSVSRNAAMLGGGLESSGLVDEPNDRFTAGWPRR